MLCHAVATSSLNDAARLTALGETRLLDRPSLASLDRYARIATVALGVPIALVSLVDRDRQFFTSQCGLGLPLSTQRETPLTHSFCQYVVLDERPLVVTDARLDPRLADNPAVAELGVIGYAGMPIRSFDGHVLGSMCVITHEPRRWSERDLAVLAEPALAVSAEIDLHRRAQRAERSERRLTGVVGELESEQTAATQATRQATHDLRTPLQVIDMALHNLRVYQPQGARPEITRLFELLERNMHHALELVTSLHEAGNLPEVAETVDLRQLVELACDDLRHRVPTIPIEIDTATDAALLVRASTRDVRRCIDNLVTNAQRFAASRIVVQMRATGSVVSLLVEDDGSGLPAAEDYERAWSSRARFHVLEGKSGSGLGLASVRAAVEWCGGRVIAHASPLGGAAFGFELQLAPVPSLRT